MVVVDDWEVVGCCELALMLSSLSFRLAEVAGSMEQYTSSPDLIFMNDGNILCTIIIPYR